MQRIQSVDILRGMTIIAMIMVNNPGDWNNVYPSLLHANWHGLTPTDLIFPCFIFIVGISISFAYNKKKLSDKIVKKILIRSLKLLGLGLFLNLFIPYFPFFESYKTVRIPGVLQRIGIVFFIVAILYLKCKKKTLVITSITILFIYFILLGFIPLPNGSLPSYEREFNNWTSYIDINILGNHLWKHDYDPEGLLSTIPSIVSCLIGVFVGEILKIKSTNTVLKQLFFLGVIFLISGYLWSYSFPINKALWTSSFVLVTAGWSTLLLLIIYYISDVKNKKISPLLGYVGTNAIVIYFLSSFISKTFYLIKINPSVNIHSFIYNNIFSVIILNDKLASLLYALTVVLFYILLGYYLFKKKIFIKV